MRAIQHHTFGPADVLHLEELPDLHPAATQLRIAVEVAGVHLLDTSIRAGESLGAGSAPELPVVPGREVAGTVDEVGAEVDKSWMGRRVVAHLGHAGGGYAEQALVAADRAYPIPEGLDPATAVASIGTGRTAAGILTLFPIRRDDVVAVPSAAGGLGVLFLQEARRLGATSIGLAGGAHKLDVARQYGARHVVDYLATDWARELAHLPAPTLVLDGVGGEVGRRLHEHLLPGGRLVRFGWSSGEENTYDAPDRSVIEVLGPPLMARLAEFERNALDAAADGSRVPHVGVRLPLTAAAEAHRTLEQRGATGKVVLVVDR